MENTYTFSPKNTKQKYLVWHIQGGLGKNVAATSLTKSIKERYPDRKFILVCSWPEVFLNNPYVDRVYQLGQSPHFYEDYIENKDVLVFRHEPYHQSGHITRKNHIIQSWCELLDLEYTDQQPMLYPNYVHKMMKGLWVRQKPIMVIHTSGGPKEGNKLSYSWARDIPPDLSQSIVDKYKDTYHIIQITRKDGYELNGVERHDEPLSNMQLFSLLAISEKRVLIDSSLQHAAAAMNLPSSVFWIGTSPNNFGYKMHNNIVAKPTKRMNQLIGSYLFDYQFDNNEHECPYYDINEIFDVNNILKSI